MSKVRCYFTGKIAEGASTVTCRYYSTTLLIPKKETRQAVTTLNMSREEVHARFLQLRKEHEQRLERSRKKQFDAKDESASR